MRHIKLRERGTFAIPTKEWINYFDTKNLHSLYIAKCCLYPPCFRAFICTYSHWVFFPLNIQFETRIVKTALDQTALDERQLLCQTIRMITMAILSGSENSRQRITRGKNSCVVRVNCSVRCSCWSKADWVGFGRLSSSSVICQTTGPQPLPKRFLHLMRSRASSFKLEYPLLSPRSSRNFLRLLPFGR